VTRSTEFSVKLSVILVIATLLYGFNKFKDLSKPLQAGYETSMRKSGRICVTCGIN